MGVITSYHHIMRMRSEGIRTRLLTIDIYSREDTFIDIGKLGDNLEKISCAQCREPQHIERAGQNKRSEQGEETKGITEPTHLFIIPSLLTSKPCTAHPCATRRQNQYTYPNCQKQRTCGLKETECSSSAARFISFLVASKLAHRPSDIIPASRPSQSRR